VTFALKGRLRQVLRQAGVQPEVLRVRLVAIWLAIGALEVLATSLLEAAAYPTEAFGEVYHCRWGMETFYGVLKTPAGAGKLHGPKLRSRAPGLLCQRILGQRGERGRVATQDRESCSASGQGLCNA
jgi:hypothetical protein